ncbi:MAG: hypothetical protein JWL83_1823 [Actinomycetia bacterium]|nr:hypothetical protein [Actinomycetes bacterium]
MPRDIAEHLWGEDTLNIHSIHRSRRFRACLFAAVMSTAVAGRWMPARALASPAAARTYVVRALPGEIDAATADLGRAGATVTRELRGIDEAVVRMTPTAAMAATRIATIANVTADAHVRLASDGYGGRGTYDAGSDPNSMYAITNVIGARDFWSSTTGDGVDVALLDSGVDPVAGLDTPGKVVYGPDLSFESQNPHLRDLDTYGHGTHMAGIIAAHDDGVDPQYSSWKSGPFFGVAPDARIVSVKLADAYGATDVSQVIAGIDWVVQHAHDNGLNIRVINLSFGTPSLQAADLDPLSYAAEAAWRHGIVVVVSVGNSGSTAGRLSDPAINPWVIAVGADDANGTRSTSDDVIPDYSSRGDGHRNPDLVAPGAHVQSLRAPGSHIDDIYGRGAGSINDRFLRGSGTSQAAAVVSGAVAMLLQQRPNLDPNEVKALLTGTARPLDAGPEAAGNGLLNLRRAMHASVPEVQSWPQSTGTGSLDAARGPQQLVLDGVPLTGEIDIFGATYDTTQRAAEEDAGTSWVDGTWNGRRWAGADWLSTSWAGTAWTGAEWNDANWAGRRWADANWSGRRWADSLWSASNFDGGDWAVGQWS